MLGSHGGEDLGGEHARCRSLEQLCPIELCALMAVFYICAVQHDSH